MLLNLLLVLYLIAMAYWWSTQRLFSAFIHLCLVIACGAMALSWWEPLAMWMLSFSSAIVHFAWGLSLLSLFLVLLAVLRQVVDRLVPMNVHFPGLIGTIGGGVCGFFSGVLTAGLTVIGLGFMPLSSRIAGYEPYIFGGDGQVVRTSSRLWPQVDAIAAGFFSGLSRGAFSTRTPLALYRPALAQQAGLFRLRLDPLSSPVAAAGSVEVTELHSGFWPVEGLNPEVAQMLQIAGSQGQRILVVDTLWHAKQGTYDGDSTLRVPSPQVRLATMGDTARQPVLHAPAAFVRLVDAEANRRYFHMFKAGVSAVGTGQQETLGWVFLVPADHQPTSLFVRGLRFDLANRSSEAEDLLAALGELPPPPAAEEDSQTAQARGDEGTVGPREGIRAGHVATQIELTNQLPRPISTNYATGLEVRDGAVHGGKATARKPPGSLSRNTRADTIYVPSHLACVRLRIEADQAQSLLGAARTLAASLQGVWLEDDRGQKWEPFAYVWDQGGEQEISVDAFNPIRSARQLPVEQMRSGHQLYLYFRVSRGITIKSYHIGQSTFQEAELRVP